jgi:hypothetical protein
LENKVSLKNIKLIILYLDKRISMPFPEETTICNNTNTNKAIVNTTAKSVRKAKINKNKLETYTLGDITIIDFNNNKYIALFIKNVYGKDKFCYVYLRKIEGFSRFDFVYPLLQKYKSVYYKEEDNIKGFLPCIY